MPAATTKARDRRLVATVLAVPFLIGIAALRGLTAALPMFHGGDELNYHLPTVLQFASQLPFPDLRHYAAAQTPLFHVLLAYASKVVGLQLWRLRLVEVAISYALALATLSLLRTRLGHGRDQALALTLLLVLSPYVLATSFRLLTDNLALLFSVVAIDRLERSRETGRTATFAAGCGAIAAAILTRQSAAFLLAIAGLYALRPGLSASRRARLLALIALAAAPSAALFATWHGLVPPGGDPSSCALCTAGRATGAAQGALVVQTPELALATIGAYGTILFAPLLATSPETRAELRGARTWIAAAAAAGALLLIVFPAHPGAHAAGLLWNAARRLPAIDGSSLLYWLLIPLSGVVLALRVRRAPRRWPVVTLLVAFLVGALAIRYPWQKYVDPYALLALLLSVRPGELAAPRQLAGAAALGAAFVAYALSFVL